MELIEERRKILLNAPHLQITPSSNFSTDVSAPLKELKIDFNPIQSGSGIPAPDNIRPIDGRQQISVRHFGKNLFDFSEAFRTSGLYYGKAVGTAIEPGSSTNVTTEVNNNIITVTTKAGWQGVCYRSIDVPNGTYTLSFNINLTNWTGSQNGRDIYVVDKNNIITRVIMHTTGLVNTTSTITLTGDESAIAISLGGRSSTYGTFEIVNLQLEAGRNKTSYEPYQVATYTTGNWAKNMCDLSFFTINGYLTASGSISSPSTTRKEKTTDYIKVKKGKPLTFSSQINTTSAPWTAVATYDANKNLITRHTKTSGTSITLSSTQTENADYVRVSIRTYGDAAEWTQLEEGSSATSYVPYVIGQEFYGGTVDLVTGKLTVDRELITVDSISTVSGTYIKSDAIDGYTTNNDIYPRIGYATQPTDLVADKLKLQNNAIWSVEGYPNCWILNNNQIHINVANDLLEITDYTQETSATAKEKLNAWLAENPVTLTIPIEPIVYQLNPVQIKALYGGNNFLTDEGDVVQINHWQHIDKLPIEYQRVEYLQSTGTQYINTKKIPTDNTKMELKTYTTCTASYYCAGARSGTSTIFFAQSGATSGSKISCTVNGTSRTAEDSDGVDFKRLSSGQMYNIMLKTNGDSTFDYSIVDETNNKSYSISKAEYTPMETVTDGICLFALNKNYIVSGTNRCYKFKLYRDGKLILSFIPCYRKKDNVAGMYDIVTGKFFTNDGTGSFAVGNNI